MSGRGRRPCSTVRRVRRTRGPLRRQPHPRGVDEVLGDPVAALDTVARLPQVEGRVLPMSTQALQIEADVVGWRRIPGQPVYPGQVAVATTPGKVRRVRLLPADPPACPDALAALGAADLAVLGPGILVLERHSARVVPELLDGLLRTPPGRCSFSPWRRSRGRPPDSPPSVICTYCANTRPIPCRPRRVDSASARRVASVTISAARDTSGRRGGLRGRRRGRHPQAPAGKLADVLAGLVDRRAPPGRQPDTTTSNEPPTDGRGKGERLVAMTAEVKDELSRLTVTQVSCRKAGGVGAAPIRGRLHIVGGRVVGRPRWISARPPGGCAARSSTCTDTSRTCTCSCRRAAQEFAIRGPRRQDGEALGAPDRAARHARASPCGGCRLRWSEAASATRRPRGAALPGSWFAHRAGALVGARDQLPRSGGRTGAGRRRRRLGIAAKAREVRGTDRVVVATVRRSAPCSPGWARRTRA